MKQNNEINDKTNNINVVEDITLVKGEEQIEDNKKCKCYTSDVGAGPVSARGITLIALVITIIVLLILAGIALTLTIGKNGIINNAKTSKETYGEAQAREKLEMTLLDLQADKLVKPEYNENEYINERLISKGFIVNGNAILVDGWQYEIDRSVPKIRASLGKGYIEESIEISLSSQLSSDYTKATITIEITYENEVTQILLNGTELEIPEKAEGKYTIQTEVTNNGSYSVIAKDSDKINTATIKISDISEDVEIRTKEDFLNFVKKMEKGATFEGKTITLMNDIDLNEGKYSAVEDEIVFNNDKETYEIITATFEGTLNGRYNTIKGIYLNNVHGIFNDIGEKGSVTNLNISGVSNINTSEGSWGIIAGTNNGNIINCGIENMSYIYSSGYDVGGIAGVNYGSIIECYNRATVTGLSYSVGGITGVNYNTVKYCYNTGAITSNGKTPAGFNNVAGIVGGNYNYVTYCYSTGIVSSSGSKGVGLVIGHQYKDNAYTNYSYAVANQDYSIIGYKEKGTTTRLFKNRRNKT